MGNSKSETESMKIKRAPLFCCAHSIVKLRTMVIHVRVYARRLTIHIHFNTASTVQKLPVYATVVANILNYVMARRGVLTNQKPPLI